MNSQVGHSGACNARATALPYIRCAAITLQEYGLELAGTHSMALAIEWLARTS